MHVSSNERILGYQVPIDRVRWFSFGSAQDKKCLADTLMMDEKEYELVRRTETNMYPLGSKLT